MHRHGPIVHRDRTMRRVVAGDTLVRLCLVALPLTLVVPRTASCQFGLRGGIDLTNFVGGSARDGESLKGLNLGLAIPVLSIGPVSIGPEVYYSQKGAKQTDPFAPGMFDFSLDYVEVPILAKLRLPLKPNRYLNAYIAGGPTYAWNVHCSISFTGTVSGCGDVFGSFDTAMQKAD